MLRPCAAGGASDRPARARPPWHAGQRGGGLVARARMPPFRGGRPLCTARSGTHPRRARSHLYALRCGRGLEPRAPGCGGRGAECREGRSDAECLHRHTHTHTRAAARITRLPPPPPPPRSPRARITRAHAAGGARGARRKETRHISPRARAAPRARAPRRRGGGTWRRAGGRRASPAGFLLSGAAGVACPVTGSRRA